MVMNPILTLDLRKKTRASLLQVDQEWSHASRILHILAEISSQAPTHWTRCTATFLPSRSIISLVILRSSGKPFHMQVDTGFGGRTVPSTLMAYTYISRRTPLLESYMTLVPSFGCAIVVRGDILRRCVFFSQVLETCLGEHKANFPIASRGLVYLPTFAIKINQM